MKYSVAIITVSDRSAAGERVDLSGPEVASSLDLEAFEIVGMEIVPDEFVRIRDLLYERVAENVALILTIGGTGFSQTDVTPEATLDVIERRADGLTEAMRAASMRSTPFAMLSRAVCGIAGHSLIVNLPGSPKGARECLETIQPVLPHALKLLNTETVPDEDHRTIPGSPG